MVESPNLFGSVNLPTVEPLDLLYHTIITLLPEYIQDVVISDIYHCLVSHIQQERILLPRVVSDTALQLQILQFIQICDSIFVLVHHYACSKYITFKVHNHLTAICLHQQIMFCFTNYF